MGGPLKCVISLNVDPANHPSLSSRSDYPASDLIQSLLDHSPDIIAILNHDGEISTISTAGSKILSGAANFFDCLPAQDREILESRLQAKGEWHGQPIISVEGTSIPLEVHASCVHDRVLIIANDLRLQRRMEQDLRHLRRCLIHAHEEERRRIARDLHDDITQKLAILSVELGGLGKGIEAVDPSLGEVFHRLRGNLIGISEDVRNVCHELHPGMLERLGLAELLRTYCRERQRLTGTLWEVIARDFPGNLSKQTQLTLYRIAQAAIRNVVKHSGATRATVVLAAKDGILRLSVIDNGCGFLVESFRDRQCLGLTGIEERARSMGGRMLLDSVAGEGTRLVVEIPLQEVEG